MFFIMIDAADDIQPIAISDGRLLTMAEKKVNREVDSWTLSDAKPSVWPSPNILPGRQSLVRWDGARSRSCRVHARG